MFGRLKGRHSVNQRHCPKVRGNNNIVMMKYKIKRVVEEISTTSDSDSDSDPDEVTCSEDGTVKVIQKSMKYTLSLNFCFAVTLPQLWHFVINLLIYLYLFMPAGT